METYVYMKPLKMREKVKKRIMNEQKKSVMGVNCKEKKAEKSKHTYETFENEEK